MSRSEWGDAALRSTLWLVLGGWVGAWVFFAFGVSTTAFRVLPSTELAGLVVGPLLAGLHVYGAAAGIVLAAVTLGLGRGPLLAAVPVLLAALCSYSELGVTGEIDSIREQVSGPAATFEATQRFGVLHRRSLALFGAVGIGAFGLLVAHARYDSKLARVETPTSDPNVA
ncbi:MAG: DUF4149 domain-containing protein [Deltaproteobacteria bacterium]|nr:DUF4149 domain-containing protein [Deltaproteobacteria bacterium]